MTRMAGDPSVTAHVWTGDEDLPKIVRVRAPEFMLGANPMPPEVIRNRSKGIRTKKLRDPGWKMIHNSNAVVRGDIAPEDLKATAVYSTELFVMLRSYLGGGDWSGLFSSRLFREGADFRQAAGRAGAANAESYYDPRSAEIVMWFGLYPTPLLYQRAFAHEFAHAYIDLVLGRTSPLWLMEGLAEWFSNLDWRGHIFVPGQANGRALLLLDRSEQEDGLLLEKLVSMPREEMYGPNFGIYYAQAWSVVDWLMVHRSARAVQDLIHGDLGDLARELVPHEAQWRDHVRMMIDSGR